MTSYYGSPEGKELARKEVTFTCEHVEPTDDPNTVIAAKMPERDFISTQAANRFPIRKCPVCSPKVELLDIEAAQRLAVEMTLQS